jgi:hypothetical protein
MARRLGQAYWQKHLEAWFQSELTQEAYCAEHGLSIKTMAFHQGAQDAERQGPWHADQQ